MENKFDLKIGDVVQVKVRGYGFCEDDVGKWVEIAGFSEYGWGTKGERGFSFKEYDEPLKTNSIEDSYPEEYIASFASLGENPMILLNTKDERWDNRELSCDEEFVKVVPNPLKEQYTGSSSDYYKVFVKNPTTLSEPYEAECNDLIEALQMDFAEGNAFKAIWRKAKARQGVKKKGYDNGVYDSEKVIFFGQRMLVKAKETE